jgi:epoxyqueuosine reductase
MCAEKQKEQIKNLSDSIKRMARDMGFHKAGIALARKLDKSHLLSEWLNRGYHGRMAWMEQYLDKRLDILHLYPEARSVLVVAHNYYTPIEHSRQPGKGKISRYAWGRDYHKIIKNKLKQLLLHIQEINANIEGRLFVDTAPVQDKLWAEAAGIGWQGKNTNILTREMGSWIFLGELVLNIELVPDSPVMDYCGSCTACIDACPTGALEPYFLDARKCISYLTIEYRNDPIPGELAPKMHNWIFGCDICQDVCPWNKFQKPTDEKGYYPVEENRAPELSELEAINEESYRKRFRGSPVTRAKHSDFIRNVRAARKRDGDHRE